MRWDKGDFRGRAPLAAEREARRGRRLRGLRADKARPPRDGCAVRRGHDEVGVVSSGNFSPVLGQGIALAFMAPDVAVGDDVVIDVRGRDLPAKVVKPPFHRQRPSG
ncbi:MAG: hypothetical protein OXC00_05375 [Acidimicrobiaceae bacterium]|nr:hypothetical protein [Acidimicrobiaceae bacterium]